MKFPLGGLFGTDLSGALTAAAAARGRRRALRRAFAGLAAVGPVGDEAMAHAIRIGLERCRAAEGEIRLARIAHRPAAGGVGKLEQPTSGPEGPASLPPSPARRRGNR